MFLPALGQFFILSFSYYCHDGRQNNVPYKGVHIPHPGTYKYVNIKW